VKKEGRMDNRKRRKQGGWEGGGERNKGEKKEGRTEGSAGNREGGKTKVTGRRERRKKGG
jgi:hypothetical protein